MLILDVFRARVWLKELGMLLRVGVHLKSLRPASLFSVTVAFLPTRRRSAKSNIADERAYTEFLAHAHTVARSLKLANHFLAECFHGGYVPPAWGGV
jgi:hypothetical protein